MTQAKVDHNQAALAASKIRDDIRLEVEQSYDALVQAKLVPSKSEARRLIEQGGVKLNNKVVQSGEEGISEGVLTVGKRKFAKVKIV